MEDGEKLRFKMNKYGDRGRELHFYDRENTESKSEGATTEEEEVAEHCKKSNRLQDWDYSPQHVFQ